MISYRHHINVAVVTDSSNSRLQWISESKFLLNIVLIWPLSILLPYENVPPQYYYFLSTLVPENLISNTLKLKVTERIYHVVITMFVPQHVSCLLLPLSERVLSHRWRKPQRDDPFRHIAHVHAGVYPICRAPGGTGLGGQGLAESVARIRRQHLKTKGFISFSNNVKGQFS